MSLSPRGRAFIQILILLAICGALFFLFPRVFGFVQMAARSLRHLWWVILLIALAVWLIWGINRKPR